MCHFLLVCVGILNKLLNSLTPEEKSSAPKIESKFQDLCLRAKKAENRFVSFCFCFISNKVIIVTYIFQKGKKYLHILDLNIFV